MGYIDETRRYLVLVLYWNIYKKYFHENVFGCIRVLVTLAGSDPLRGSKIRLTLNM